MAFWKWRLWRVLIRCWMACSRGGDLVGSVLIRPDLASRFLGFTHTEIPFVDIVRKFSDGAGRDTGV